MYRYFLHELSDWPLDGACNATPLGPDAEGQYVATLDASDPHCEAYELALSELTVAEARAWVATLADEEAP